MVRGVTIGKQAVMLGLSVVLMTALGGVAYSKDDPTLLLEEILTQLGTLQTTVNGVQTDVNGLETDVSNLQTDVDNLPGALGPCEVPPVWGKKFAGDVRFVSVLDGAAYCDQETGLVWEESPDTTPRNWIGAISHCANREVGGRKGWQLPMREQLASLVDTSNTAPALPTGHPFLNVQSAFYWSASTLANAPTSAWFVLFDDGVVGAINKGTSIPRTWCVRGGQAYDGQDVLNAVPPS